MCEYSFGLYIKWNVVLLNSVIINWFIRIINRVGLQPRNFDLGLPQNKENRINIKRFSHY